MKKKNISLNLLKVLTMFLIINSHADILYPSRMSFLASGGSIGNELFFLISGFLFSAKDDVIRDIKRRFIRLYLPAYIMIIFTALFGLISIDGVVKAIRVFIWPTQFWFVGAIFLYSILLYALIAIDIDKKSVFLTFAGVLVVIDVILYVFCIPDKSTWIVEDAYLAFIPFRSVYSIFSFVFGYYLKKNKNLIQRINERATICIAVVMFIGVYGFKMLLNKQIVPMPLQIISQMLTVLCAVFIFISFVKVDMNPRLEGTRRGKWINELSSLSLESYLVQFLIITWVGMLHILFPINMVLCFGVVIVAAWMLHKFTGCINKVFLE